MANIIQWKQGYRARVDVEKVLPELESIRKQNGDITPRAVLDKAKAKRNPMHRQFEWDDSVAGDKYRLEQARAMIRSVEIIHVQSPSAPAKAYSLITKPSNKPDEEPRKVYQSTEEALQDPVMRDEVLGNAIREAIAFRRKYAALQELAKVFVALDSFIENAG